MELNFVETIEEKEWVAEFEAPSDFNLHIERADSGSLVVSQIGTASGEYETAFVKGMYEGGIVIDCDFGALVYPKWIKVTSSSEVVNGYVNFNEGGGSGSGSGSDNVIYYEMLDGTEADSNVYNMVKNVAASIKILLQNGRYVFGENWGSDGAGWNDVNYLKAFAFMPIDMDIEYDNKIEHTHFPDFETYCQKMGESFESMVKRRITAEEYWAELNAE